MEKNYYDWLEVSNKASSEVIEKAYKTLVKKYHPDLQEGQAKIEYEEILKHINEAYEVLSDPIKKEAYDRTLKRNSFSEENYNNLYDENQKLKNEINNLNIEKQTREYQEKASENENYGNFYNDNSNSNNINPNNYKQEINNFNEYEQKINDAVNQAYYNAYIQDLKNKGYRIKYKKTFKQYVQMFIAIIVIILIFILLWQIPAIQNYFINLYNTNMAFKFLIDIFKNIFNAFKR